MSLQCSICLCSFKEPVCLPCGHIYCKKCLADHVNVPTNTGMTSTCPDCRTTFHIAVPDLTYLPAKYHPFISTAVRRVFIDDSGYVAMEKKLKQVEKQLANMKTKEESRIQHSEQLADSLLRAKVKVRDLEKNAKGNHDVIQKLEAKLLAMEEKYRRKSSECKKLALKNTKLEQQFEQSDSLDLSSDHFPLSSPEVSRVMSTSSKSARAVKPLPRRSLIQRRVREDGDSPVQNFIHSKRPRLSDLS